MNTLERKTYDISRKVGIGMLTSRCNAKSAGHIGEDMISRAGAELIVRGVCAVAGGVTKGVIKAGRAGVNLAKNTTANVKAKAAEAKAAKKAKKDTIIDDGNYREVDPTDQDEGAA